MTLKYKRQEILAFFFAIFGCGRYFKSELRRNGWR